MRFSSFIIAGLFSISAMAVDKCEYRDGNDIPKFWANGTMMLIEPNIDEIYNYLNNLEKKYSAISKEEIIKELRLRYEEGLKFAHKENPEIGAYYENCKPIDSFEIKTKEQILDYIKKHKNKYVRDLGVLSTDQTQLPSPTETLVEPTSYFRKFVKCTKTQSCGLFNSEYPSSFYFPVLD